VDKYDLEILTDDWTKYDANRAITRTSRLAPEDINAFVDRFEGEIMAGWQRQVQNYQTGANTPEEDLLVAGYFRTQLVYRLLSEDLIERLGGAGDGEGEAVSREQLCRRLVAETESDNSLVWQTIDDFITKGFLKDERNGEKGPWYWTHNNRIDVLPD